MPGKFFNSWLFSVASGETIGFQITLLLTVVVYIEYLQSSIPEFSNLDQTPCLLSYFVILIILLTIAILGKIFRTCIFDNELSYNLHIVPLQRQLLRIQKLFPLGSNNIQMRGKTFQ